MKNTLITAAALWVACAAMTGCIREDIEPCPPLSVKIAVKDKNYANIADIEQQGLDSRVDENQPFRAYIQKLYYSLTDVKTGEVVFTQHLHDVQGDAEMATAYLPEDLPFGTYALTVWGNIDNEAPIQEDGRYYTMHTDEVEGYDVYMTNDTLVYDYDRADYIVELERVKGKLIVQGLNLPADVHWSRKAAGHRSLYAVRHGLYAGGGSVFDVTSWQGQPEVITHTVLAPTAEDTRSAAQFNLYDSEAMTTPRLSTGQIPIDMERNRIEVIRLDYNGEADKLDVYLLVNARWEHVYDLELGEQPEGGKAGR